MTATDIAAYGAVVVSAIGVVFGIYVSKRKDRAVDASADGLNLRKMAEMLKDERDALKRDLEHTTHEYEKKLADLQVDYEQKIAAAEIRHVNQISDLRAEIDGLYRRLYGQPNIPPVR